MADQVREHGPLPPEYVAVLLEQLLLGLAAVHAAGLVHRDVKPANLLLEATGHGTPHLRLGDFKVAAPVADRRVTTVSGAIGTDGYMAPEQARGAPPDPEARLASAAAALRVLRRLDVAPEPGPEVPDRLGPLPGRSRRTLRVGEPTAPGVDWLGWTGFAALTGVLLGCLCLLLGWWP